MCNQYVRPQPLWRAILDGFCTLTRIQFAAPWRPRVNDC
jgi:hypothetical protein